ncbi:WD repeat-containing protein 1 [Entomortierella beljakovae]|nr:WD repeat-containing protein 1 [Entomortierella beljakovae]
MSAIRSSIFACAPATTRGQGVHLDTDPKGESLLYTNGKSVFIRNIENPHIAKEYTQHSCNVTVAKYAPSGYYIASGDERGNVRIWDTVGDEQILKLESKAISGKINDIAWDGESKRIIAVGDGREKFGHAFLVDSGSSCGEIMGHSKVVNTVAIRHTRPFRAVTGGDDNTLVYSNGVPFVYNKTIKDHTRFIQEVKFSNNGDMFASVGSDGKIFLYDAKTGDKLKEISTADHGHTGSIFALSWSADSARILTSSADKTSKIWDVETSSVVSTFDFSSDSTIQSQQIGNVWKGNNLLSLSLSGDLNYLDPSTSKTSRVVKGHQKAITAFAVSSDKKTLFSGSYDGRVLSWDEGSGVGTPLKEASHDNQVMQMTTSGAQLISVGMDDTVRVSSESTPGDVSVISTNALPKSVSASDDQTIVVATENEIQIIQGGKKVGSLPVNYSATTAAINPQGNLVAIGNQDAKVHIMKLEGNNLTAVHTLEKNKGGISALAFNPEGTLLAAGDNSGKIFVFDVATGESKINQWVFHSARVTSVSWSSCGQYAVSGSLDTNVYVWSVQTPMKKIAILNAHALSVSGAAFVEENKIVTTGADACVKTWKLTHH